jgi:hypothetical protein
VWWSKSLLFFQIQKKHTTHTHTCSTHAHTHMLHAHSTQHTMHTPMQPYTPMHAHMHTTLTHTMHTACTNHAHTTQATTHACTHTWRTHHTCKQHKKLRAKEGNQFKSSFFGAGVVVSAKHISSTPKGESSSTVELQIGGVAAPELVWWSRSPPKHAHLDLSASAPAKPQGHQYWALSYFYASPMF